MSLLLVLVLMLTQVGSASAASKSIHGSYFSSLLKAPKSAPRGSNLRGLQEVVDPVDDDFFDQMNMNDNNAMTARTVPNDAYHCRDPSLIEEHFWKDKTVQCDWDTYEWKTDKLDEKQIPSHCIDEGFVFTTVQALKDWQEPCYLWMTLYGDLPVTLAAATLANTTTDNVTSTVSKTPTAYPTVATWEPTASPTLTAQTKAPTWTPTAKPSTRIPTANPTAQDTPSTAPTNVTSSSSPTTRKLNTTSSAPTPQPVNTLAPNREFSLVETNYTVPSTHPSQAPVRIESADLAPVVPTSPPVPKPNRTYAPHHPPTSAPVSKPTRTYPPHSPTATEANLDTVSDDKIHIFKISTMVLTYQMEPAPQRRKLQWSLVDRALLEDVTAHHVETEIKRRMTFWWKQQPNSVEAGPLEFQVDLTLTPVRSSLLPNETMVATEALSGLVTITQMATTPESSEPSSQGLVVWPESIEPELEQAFEGNALKRYVQDLQETPDVFLQRTTDIQLGLPMDLLGDSTNQASKETPPEETVWTVAGVEFSLTTLAIIAASIAAFSILLLICVCWRLRVIRKQAMEQNRRPNTKPSLSTEESEADDKKASKNKNKTNKPRRSLRRPSKIGKGKSNPNSTDQQPTEIAATQSSEAIDETDPNNNRYYQRYVAEHDDRSLATSTYSYIDPNLHGQNTGVSLAPSFLYGNDDASLQSRAMWSLIDGITNQGDESIILDPDANYNYDQTASPTMARRPDTSDIGMLTPEGQSTISPSNMMISTVTKGEGFSEESDGDDLTLTSLVGGNATYERVAVTATEAKVDTLDSGVFTPTNPFDVEPNDENINNDARNAARMGISARKKRGSNVSSSNRPSPVSAGCVRKALGQLSSCASSNKEPREDEEPLICTAPSDEAGPTVLERRSSSAASKNLADSTLNDVSGRSTNLGDSSRNSSLQPDMLFPDDTVEDSAAAATETPKVNVKVSVIDTSQLLRDSNGNYIIDTMSSF